MESKVIQQNISQILCQQTQLVSEISALKRQVTENKGIIVSRPSGCQMSRVTVKPGMIVIEFKEGL